MRAPIPDCAHGGLKPDRLWSLWEMVSNFRFSAVQHLLWELSLLIGTSHKNAEYVARAGVGYNRHQALNHPTLVKALEQSLQTVPQLTDMADTILGGLKCSHIHDAIKKLELWAAIENPSWSELNVRSRALSNAITTELRDYYFYQYPKDKGLIASRWENDWKEVYRAFPDTEFDIWSATDCYALQHYTASIFHSMRVAEIGLRALAKERNISLPKNKPVEWATWQEIITKLEEESKRIGQTWGAGKAKDAALEFYSGARADLNGFKDEYRNQCAHVRVRYDEYQAIRALTKVREFMDRIAAKIDMSHRPINWEDA